MLCQLHPFHFQIQGYNSSQIYYEQEVIYPKMSSLREISVQLVLNYAKFKVGVYIHRSTTTFFASPSITMQN